MRVAEGPAPPDSPRSKSGLRLHFPEGVSAASAGLRAGRRQGRCAPAQVGTPIPTPPPPPPPPGLERFDAETFPRDSPGGHGSPGREAPNALILTCGFGSVLVSIRKIETSRKLTKGYGRSCRGSGARADEESGTGTRLKFSVGDKSERGVPGWRTARLLEKAVWPCFGHGNATDANSGSWCLGRSVVRAMSGTREPGRRRCGQMSEEAAVVVQDSADAGWDEWWPQDRGHGARNVHEVE